MIHYLLPDGFPTQRLPFYLAMEEWVARHIVPGEEGFFTWQVNPTVIFGRNQQIDAEVDLDYCRDNGIEAYRRKSGGGCVFADRSNIMFSYITASPRPIAEIFADYTGRIAEMLRSMGIPAESTGRNDVTIGGRKVSGNAFYLTPSGRSIVHGTMLYDTDMSHMTRAITPSRSKMESKKVQSVESRVTMLCRHTEMTIDEFRDRAEAMLSDSERHLTQADVEEIKEIAESYYTPQWIYGRLSNATHTCRRRIEGVGDIEAAMRLDREGRIADINLTGDFFPIADLGPTLLDRLRGVRPKRADIENAIAGIDVSQVISRMDNDTLVELLSTTE